MGNNVITNHKVKEQYKNAKNLNSRLKLHSYNINKIDWNHWCFNEMNLPKKAKVLELGCGTGTLWLKNQHRLNKDWSITLSDFSKGMLENAKEALDQVDYNFRYEEIDVQDIPYEEESFDVIIARHMLYHVPDIEKALSEIKRVLNKDGIFYATTNGCETMSELHELIEKFDPEIGLNNCGMGERFDSEGGQRLLEKYFSEVKMKVFEGKIIVSEAEPIVSYVGSTVKGSIILVGQNRQDFTTYVEEYIKEKGDISITTKACIFKVKN